MAAELGLDPRVDARMRQLQGPTAMGEDSRRFWVLLWVMARTEFRLRFHGSVLGYSWSLIHPVLMFGVLYLFFSQVIRFGDEVENFAIFLLFNIMMFRFFSEATSGAVASIVSRENMIRSSGFPRLVIPLSVVLTSLFNLALTLPAVFGYMLISGVDPMWTWLLLPVIVGALTFFTAGIAILLASWFVALRDLSQVWSVLVQGLFYATPVIYPIVFVPDSWREIAYANPLAAIFTQARVWIIDPSAPNAAEVVGGTDLIVPVFLFFAIPVAGLWYFWRNASKLAERL